MLLSHCFICRAGFLPEELSSASPASKYAFDSARGRLWIVCSACGAWNLVPIETRWETIEVLEKRARDRGRVLAKTDNIALIDADGLSLIRIGRTQRKEEAWWRYLKEAENRRRNTSRVVRLGKWKNAFINFLIFGAPVPAGIDAATWISNARLKQFSRSLWKGRAPCRVCGAVDQQLDFKDPLVLAASESSLIVRGLCGACRTRGSSAGFELSGPAATWIAQRKLAYMNYAGASEDVLDVAVHTLDNARSAASFLHDATLKPIDFTTLDAPRLVAFEMAINEARELELLTLQARELEVRWKHEEEIALIVDRELTP